MTTDLEESSNARRLKENHITSGIQLDTTAEHSITDMAERASSLIWLAVTVDLLIICIHMANNGNLPLHRYHLRKFSRIQLLKEDNPVNLNSNFTRN